LVSCQYFEKQIPSEDELLQKKLKEINWKEVTVYPSIEECKGLTNKEQARECFFTNITKIIQEKLDIDVISLHYPGVDTINVKITVSSVAKITFEPQFPNDIHVDLKTKIDSIIQNRLTGFPKIEPAQKEGIPVNTQFILPIVIKKQ